MLLKFIPESMPEGYEGHIMLRMPTYAQRLDIYSSGDFVEEVAKDSAPDKPESEARMARKSRKLMQHVAEILGKFVAEVHIVRKKDGFTFLSFEQLNYDSDMIPVLTEAAAKILGKYEVGSPS